MPVKSMRFLKISVSTIFFLVVMLGWFFPNHSIVTTSYACEGSFTDREVSYDSQLYFELREYRWWVWGESEGNLWIEIPLSVVVYFPMVEKIGNLRQISDWEHRLVGNFSTLSKVLSIDTGVGWFEGQCSEL